MSLTEKSKVHVSRMLLWGWGEREHVFVLDFVCASKTSQIYQETSGSGNLLRGLEMEQMANRCRKAIFTAFLAIWKTFAPSECHTYF